jgi:hypothetical protein
MVDSILPLMTAPENVRIASLHAMAIQLDEDQRTLDSAQALIAALAKADIPSDKLLDPDLPKEIEKLFYAFSKNAYKTRS